MSAAGRHDDHHGDEWDHRRVDHSGIDGVAIAVRIGYRSVLHREFGTNHAVESPEKEAMRHEMADRVEQALAPLDTREREVLRLRFGLGTDHEHTLAEIARRLSISRERVRQIEARAIAKLRPAPAA